MSYDLWVWKGPVPRSGGAFIALIGRFEEGDEGVFEASPAVRAFADEILARYPALEDLPDEAVDEGLEHHTRPIRPRRRIEHGVAVGRAHGPVHPGGRETPWARRL